MDGYGQFCTVARGAEIFGARWTPLVVRELLCGSTRFNDIHRGVPRMSATLLTTRLRKLEEVGVLRRVRAGNTFEYHLTQAGEELRPIVVGLGQWGARWIRLGDFDLRRGEGRVSLEAAGPGHLAGGLLRVARWPAQSR